MFIIIDYDGAIVHWSMPNGAQAPEKLTADKKAKKC